MAEIYAALAAAAVAVIGAAASFAVSWFNNKKTASELSSLREKIDSSEQLYSVVCPNCGAKIYLNKVTISAEKKEGDANAVD